MPNQDIVVIGASAGGVEAIQTLLGGLPSDFQGTCFVVLHIAQQVPDSLPRSLGRHATIPVAFAEDRQPFFPGHVYVAPPNRHLLLEPKCMRVLMGPRENRSRPAIDPLFRSAAIHFGPRAVGVLLTGLLQDGTSGLLAIRRCNGVTVIQDPDNAQFPDMPRSALEHLRPDHQASIEQLPELLGNLVTATAKARVPAPPDIESEVRMVQQLQKSADAADAGALVALSCPECGGPLREKDDSGLTRFRCQVGHAFTEHSLLDENSEAIERVLWIALRSLQEKIRLYQNLAKRESKSGGSILSERYQKEIVEIETYVGQVQTMLSSLLRRVA